MQQEENLVSLCADIATLRKQWQQVTRAKQVMAQYQKHYLEGNWCDILRKRFIEQHREIFEAAIGYLSQEQLKRKIELEEMLTHWRALMSNRRSAGYYRWLDNLAYLLSS
ncbi:hypothetical protein [Cronobacter dublinensis]|uniref:hypothetical protein n=1 Tax=Cronobacter dublinensis TaxID=413497 RepID=UPI0035174C04